MKKLSNGLRLVNRTELKVKTSQILAMVQESGPIYITSRGNIVVKMIPVRDEQVR